ncbi:MAG: hypothetical protein KUA37_02700 [Desulfomicrobium sp.]|nr:hypothetical protein [Pseudomonadota bacterium]MBV1710903.1 hypothetical protein [Desulfomicrobium sp.]MBU4570557.1 hypothetical protein [Pseudomonadota bacterium]MBU4593321.1 hypothetical protein [Pseudomonadota bacterium]MBV1719365.1 hypothetical protein [Desulfomicrobium sp.]
MIDKDTRLESVFCDQKNFVIKYTLVNLDLSKIDVKKFNQVLEEKITRNICMQEDNKKFLDSGVGYYFTYFDNNGDYISKIYINNSSCNTGKISNKIWTSNDGNYIAIFPQQPDLNSIQTEYGVTTGYSSNEKIDNSHIMYSITEFPKYSQNNKKLAEMTIREYLSTFNDLKIINNLNWINYSNDEARCSYEFSYTYEGINAIEKGFMSLYKDNMIRVSFTYILSQDETITNKGNIFLNSFKFLTK